MHLYHWYAKVEVGEDVQPPRLAVKTKPTFATPETVGASAFTGVWSICALVALYQVFVPAYEDAVTNDLRYLPTSSVVSVNDAPSPSGMTVQPLGRAELTDALALVHLTQPLCRVGVGVPSHVPNVPVRTLPSFGVPVTTGYLVPLTAGGRPTASVVGVNTDDAPLALLAITLI